MNQRSSVWSRGLSIFLDGIILMIVWLPFSVVVYNKLKENLELLSIEEIRKIRISSLIGFISSSPAEIRNILIIFMIISFIIAVIYHALIPWKRNGATFGRSALEIRIARVDDKPIGFWQLFVREIIFKNVWWNVWRPLGIIIDFFMVLLRDDRQTLRDMVCQTRVIND